MPAVTSIEQIFGPHLSQHAIPRQREMNWRHIESYSQEALELLIGCDQLISVLALILK
jgi:hypothetical protein